MNEQLEKQELENLAVETNGNFPVNDLLGRYDIKKAAMYNRLNFLKITPVKEKGKSFLLPEQLHHMDELDKHIKTHGTMEGYSAPEWNLKQHTIKEEEVLEELAIAPDASISAAVETPEELAIAPDASISAAVETPGELAIAPDTSITAPVETSGEITIAPDTSITAPETPVTQQIELETPPSPEIDTNLIAQKARTIAKEIIISKQLGQNLAENPDLLPEEDRQEIEAITQQFAAHFPKAQRKRPEELAKAMLVKFSQSPAIAV